MLNISVVTITILGIVLYQLAHFELPPRKGEAKD